jgi:hypothetical protein
MRQYALRGLMVPMLLNVTGTRQAAISAEVLVNTFVAAGGTTTQAHVMVLA